MPRNAARVLLACAGFAAAAGHAAWPSIQWQVTVQGSGGHALDSPRAAIDASGNLLVAARERDGARSCIFVAKFPGTGGAATWRRSLCDLDGSPRAIAVDSLGHVVVGGTVRGAGNSSNARVLKFDRADGRTHWERIFDLGTGAADEAVVDIAIDASRDVYVAMSSSAGGARLAKYGEGGTLRWQSAPFDRLVAVAVDASGTPFSAGSLQASGSDRWIVTRYVAATGTETWNTLGAPGSVANAMAVDAAGNPVVTGTVPARATTDMRTIKYAAGNGDVLWQRDLLVSDDSRGNDVAVDPFGDVIVTGSAGTSRETLAYAGTTGSLLWRHTELGRGGKAASGRAIVFDPAGNPVIGGEEGPSGASGGDFTVHTTSLDTNTGAEIWSVPFDGPGSSEDRFGSLLAAADGIVTVGASVDRGELVLVKYGFAATAALNVQALWWRAPAGSQSGWGVNLTHQGDLLFATWFTYDAQRRPLWMVMSEGVRVGVNEYRGAVYQVSGPPFDSASWDAARVQPRAVGAATFAFTDAGSGTFRFVETAGATLTHPITRQVFAQPVPTCTFGGEPSAANFTDLWWRSPPGSESGWGLNLVQQGDVIFATWFTYGADGSPVWFVASDLRRGAGNTFAGELYRTAGPGFATLPWDPATVTVTPVGSATLAFTGPSAGTFSYVVDGVSGIEPITRQLFGSPQTVCR